MKDEISICLVDDNEASNFYHRQLIKRTGVSVDIREFQNGREAMNYVLQCEAEDFPNIIFLDLNMPLLDGFEFLTELRDNCSENISDTCIVVLTSGEKSVSEAKCRAIYEDILFETKPMRLEQMKTILTQLSTES